MMTNPLQLGLVLKQSAVLHHARLIFTYILGARMATRHRHTAPLVAPIPPRNATAAESRPGRTEPPRKTRLTHTCTYVRRGKTISHRDRARRRYVNEKGALVVIDIVLLVAYVCGRGS